MRLFLGLLPLALLACRATQTVGDDKSGDTDTGVVGSDPDDTGNVAVDGPDIEVTPDALDLGTTATGIPVSSTVTVANLGNAPLTASITVTTGGDKFGVNSTGAYLVAGGSTAITVTLSGDTVGSYTGALTFTSDDPDEPTVVVALAGRIDVDSDGDGFVDNDDCDPNDASINPAAEEVWYDGIDSDCDGASDYDQDGDGYDSLEYGGDDCDDQNYERNPGAEETWYDGVDQDCDNRSDYDQDGDGYDSIDYSGADCDDTNAGVSPGSFEVESNGLDDDCDGTTDEARSTEDRDGDGFSEVDGDCNDADATVYPDATDAWYDGLDSDCDGASDYDQDADGEDDAAYGGSDCLDTDATVNAAASQTYYDGIDQNCDGISDFDADADGYDSADYGGTDCDDADATVSPGSAETYYDGVDSNCDGESDFDADADGYDDSAYGGGDCDDADGSVNAGATEACDGIDQDCDGEIDEGAETAYYADSDADGYGDYSTQVLECSAPAGYVTRGTDCDDANAAINPLASETCDGVDQDCDGTIDDGVTTTYYADADADGYGSTTATTAACSAPAGYVATGTDCNDANATINPAATETCDGVDQDCDGAIDEGLPGVDTFYSDSDGDGYGNPDLATTACTAPAGFVTDSTDCDDSDSSINPGESEVGYDVADNDCNGAQDDMVASDWTDWTVTSNASSDYTGSGSLALAPDLNLDGDNELLIGSPNYDLLYYYYYTYSNTGMLGFFDVDDRDYPADAEDGFYDVWGTQYDQLGSAIALGNTDGGSYTEIAVSAPYDSAADSYAGTVYIFDIYGETGSDYASYSSEAVIEGQSEDGLYGSSLAMGDFDGDGGYDLAAGAPGESSGRGRVYVSLSDDGFSSGTMDSDDSSYRIRGVSNSDALGTAVAFGDFNDDGYDDLVACSPGDDDGGSGAGTCWIDHGSSSRSASDTTVSSLDEAVITGPAASANLGGKSNGIAVGDLDNDGIADLAVGLDGYASVATGAGAAAIWKGGSLSGSETVATADWLVQGSTASGGAGSALAFGDLTNDGIADLLIGAPGGGASAEGIAYLFAGGQTSGTYNLPSDQYASWTGPSASSLFGSVVAGALDLDDDGVNDFAVSAPYSDESATNGGEVFVLPGY